MQELSNEKIKIVVRERYADIATGKSGSCCGGSSSCGSDQNADSGSQALGYSSDDLKALPEGADLGLGCGNPQQIASLKPGEVVVDLGSGAGIDCFLAARQVGPDGRVIGVDMTHEMLAKARENARKGKFENTEFRLGEIEHLPVADNAADAIISNCVINLSTDKAQVFREAFRILKAGGRLAVSDVVATAELPKDVERDLSLYAGCVAGAISIGKIEGMLKSAGFADVRITPKSNSKDFIREWVPGGNVEDYVVSANIEARKPA